MLPLTRRQHEVLAFLHIYVAEHGFPPTARELSNACALGGPHGAHRMLDTLERKGYLARSRGKRRSLTLVERHFELALSGTSVRKLETFRGAAAFHRDCALQVAVRLPEDARKDAVLASAIEHHRLARSIASSLPRLDAAESTCEIGARTSALLAGDGFWPAFVVHSAMLSGFVAAMASREIGAAELAVQLAAAETSKLARRDAAVCAGWLEELKRARAVRPLRRLAHVLHSAYASIEPSLAASVDPEAWTNGHSGRRSRRAG